MLRLYGYWRSTAAYRVRIALNFKGIGYETVSVNLVKDGGAQHLGDYRSVNPQGRVPALLDGDLAIGQSMAIIEYLEETHPLPALLPNDPGERALARQIAQIIACDVHPLNNVSVLKFLEVELGIAEPGRNRWYANWVRLGLDAVEELLAARKQRGGYCLGDSLSVADLYVVPQLYNARRFKVPFDHCRRLQAVEAACLELDAFQRALPENQPDAPK